MKKDSINENEDKIIELDYSSKNAQILIKEFTILLNQISKNYEEKIYELEISHNKEINSLKELCVLYEKQMKNSKKINSIKAIKRYNLCLRKKTKELIIRLLRFLFKLIKKIAIIIRLKDKLKCTKIFSKLYDKGVIDKLAGRNTKAN